MAHPPQKNRTLSCDGVCTTEGSHEGRQICSILPPTVYHCTRRINRATSLRIVFIVIHSATHLAFPHHNSFCKHFIHLIVASFLRGSPCEMPSLCARCPFVRCPLRVCESPLAGCPRRIGCYDIRSLYHLINIFNRAINRGLIKRVALSNFIAVSTIPINPDDISL